MSTHESLGDTPEITLRGCKVRAGEMLSKLISLVTPAEGLDLIASTIQLIIIHDSSSWTLSSGPMHKVYRHACRQNTHTHEDK